MKNKYACEDWVCAYSCDEYDPCVGDCEYCDVRMKELCCNCALFVTCYPKE